MVFGQRASVSWTAGASAARPRFRTHGNLSHQLYFPSARKRRRRSRSAGALQIRPTQTALGRPAGTLPGSAPVPGGRFRRRARPKRQRAGALRDASRGSVVIGQRASVSWTAGASAARPRFRTHGNFSHHECFSSVQKRRRRSRSAGALQNRPPQTALGRIFAAGSGARIVPIRSAPPDQSASKLFQPSLVRPPAASWDNSRSTRPPHFPPPARS